MRKSIGTAFSFLIILSLVSPSWGWIRGGRGWGFRGGGPGIYLGGPWWPYAYPYGYPYDPYYSYPDQGNPDYYGAPYGPDHTPPQVSQAAPSSVSSDDDRRDLTNVNAQLASTRHLLDYTYQDGDMTRAERRAAREYLDAIEKLARSEANAGGGTLSVDQENVLLDQIRQADPAVHRDPSAPYPPVEAYAPAAPTVPVRSITPPHYNGRRSVDDLLLELRALLDQKLKDGAITKTQRDAEAAYLNQIDQQARSEANENNGTLTTDQEEDLVQQLHRAYYAINHNLIVN